MSDVERIVDFVFFVVAATLFFHWGYWTRGHAIKTEKVPRTQCWPWAHHWTKWETVERGDITVVDRESGKVLIKCGSYEKQSRVCETCGMSDLRKVTT